jgi:regulatory protein spx
MITLYELPSNTSSRKAKARLIEFGVPFTLQNMHQTRLTFEQLKEILSYTENGVEDIIANGKEVKMLKEEGVDFEEITLSEFYHYVKRFPKLIKAPIAIGNHRMAVGYSDELYEVFRPRVLRLQSYSKQLEKVRAREAKFLAEGKVIATGHRG